MTESQPDNLSAELLLLARLRRVVIGEILQSLGPTEAHQAISTAIQRLAQYRDEGRAPSIAKAATDEQFDAAIDRVTEELRETPRRP